MFVLFSGLLLGVLDGGGVITEEAELPEFDELLGVVEVSGAVGSVDVFEGEEPLGTSETVDSVEIIVFNSELFEESGVLLHAQSENIIINVNKKVVILFI